MFTTRLLLVVLNEWLNSKPTSKKGHTKMQHLSTTMILTQDLFLNSLNTGSLFKFKHRLHIFFAGVRSNGVRPTDFLIKIRSVK
jgi:hypothetical protein